MTTSVDTTLLERFLPAYDVSERHEIVVRASPQTTYRIVRELDLGRSIPAMVLVVVRGIPHYLMGKARPSRHLTLDDLKGLGFIVLAEDPPREIVMGAVGRFWRPDSGLHPVGAEDFTAFAERGFAKAVINFRVEELDEGRTRVITETRVHGTDAGARRRFAVYWKAIAPFSGFIRGRILELVKRAAESA